MGKNRSYFNSSSRIVKDSKKSCKSSIDWTDRTCYTNDIPIMTFVDSPRLVDVRLSRPGRVYAWAT